MEALGAVASIPSAEPRFGHEQTSDKQLPDDVDPHKPMTPEAIMRQYAALMERLNEKVAQSEKSARDLRQLLQLMEAAVVPQSADAAGATSQRSLAPGRSAVALSAFDARDRQNVIDKIQEAEAILHATQKERVDKEQFFETRIMPNIQRIQLRQETLERSQRENGVFTSNPTLYDEFALASAKYVIRIDDVCRLFFGMPPRLQLMNGMPPHHAGEKKSGPLLSLSPPPTHAPTRAGGAASGWPLVNVDRPPATFSGVGSSAADTGASRPFYS
jgi:hypothetical protein